jgi:group I intron endonuclease
MKTYIIYEHISPSGKVYVGQTCNLNLRWVGNGRNYLQKNKKGQYVHRYFAHALLKYGWENFEHKIVLDGISKSEADYAEKYLIKWYKIHGISYNIVDGGEGVCGLKFSDATRRRMSERMLKNSPFKGVPKSEQQKQKQREKMLDRRASDEVRARMSKAHTGTKSPWKHKRVFAFDKQTGAFVKSYESISEAAKELHITGSGISNAANGKCPSMGGFIWSFDTCIDINDKKYKMMEDLKVYCYNKEGDHINTFQNTTEAAAFVNGIINCINDCCSGRTKTYKGYIWRKVYKSKEEISNEYNNWRKKICA